MRFPTEKSLIICHSCKETCSCLPSPKCALVKSNFLNELKDNHSFHPKPEENTTSDFQCKTCNSYYNSRKELEEHCRSIYKAYFCDHCNEFFNDSHDCSSEHARCAFCKEASQNIFSKPETHICFHKYKVGDLEKFKDKGLVECILCFKKIPKDVMDRHRSTHELAASTGSARHCEHCLAVFANLAEYNQHYKTQHPEEPGTCKMCGISFPNFKKLMTHRQEKHIVKMKCRICDKEFDSYTIKEHMRQVHGEEECPKCDQAFLSMELLATDATHQEEHLENKNTCGECKLNFRSKSDYKKHWDQVHGRRGMVCAFCGRVVKDMPGHISKRHGPPLNLHCETCGKHFTKKEYLSRHHLVHTNDFKHKCSVCGKGFKTRYSMRVHLRSHDEVKPFECMVCLKTFTTKQWRDKHMMTH